MSLFQKGLGAQSSTFATRPWHLTRGVRLPRARRAQRNSSSKSQQAQRGSNGHGDSVNTNAPVKNPRSTPPSSTPSPSPNTAAAAAGAATTPAMATATRSRGIREALKASRLGQLGRWYSDVQARKPYATQLWSSIVIYLCGDLSAQFMFPSEKPAPAREDEKYSKSAVQQNEKEATVGGYEPWRTVRHLIVGAGSSIPSYNWFMFLHNNFNYGSKALSILTKVLVQQMCFTPVFNTYFFSMHSLLAGATLDETWERVKKALPVSITNSVKLWPAVTAFSFMYVPPQFRNVFSGVIAVGWQTYLSWLNQKAAAEVLAAELAEIEKLGASPGGQITGNAISAAGTA
ncbi:hypothetical protein N7492_007086 [Penicillium capsulatum]|uniref:Mpv17/PMP22 n=1 Tax=Penicillium capsulatum TaxID=69766 RepID=A0A9W9I0L5_9EURO|nr:hypothetical protein N7492_007086 [Penicillium capsulatum]KAJ6116920.1 hypothetical protein N7512_006645 [Penicillium capsulatum]